MSYPYYYRMLEEDGPIPEALQAVMNNPPGATLLGR